VHLERRVAFSQVIDGTDPVMGQDGQGLARAMMWRGGVSPEVSSSPWEVFPVPAVPPWYAEEGASISIIMLEQTP
jgi:hypothetical protein